MIQSSIFSIPGASNVLSPLLSGLNIPGLGITPSSRQTQVPAFQNNSPALPKAPPINRPTNGMAMNMNVPENFQKKGLLSMNDISLLLSQNKTMNPMMYYQDMIPKMSRYGRYL